MSELTCGSCGASNSPELLYCARCGDTLKRSSAPVSGTAGAAAMINRGQIQPAIHTNEADPISATVLLVRLRKLFLYLAFVGAGVLTVMAFMDPHEYRLSERRVLGANAIVRRVFADSRSFPSSLSQSTVNSYISLQSPYTLDSPVRLIPMPVWSLTRVELFPSCVRVHATLTILGLPMLISETFVLKGLPGSWMLEPNAGTVGLIGVPRFLLPVLTFAIRPAFFCVDNELSGLSAARTLAIRSGAVEFTTR